MNKLNHKIVSLFLALIISIGMFSFPAYAISTSCVEDHFDMLKFDYEGTDNDEIRTPPSERSCAYISVPGPNSQSTNQIVYITDAGSYVDSDGIIYLVESDMELYLAGELDVYALAQNAGGLVTE